MLGIVGVIFGAISVIPFPYLGFAAPVAFVLSIVSLVKKQIALGITALLLSLIGFATSPVLWTFAATYTIKAYCLVAPDCTALADRLIVKPIEQKIVDEILKGNAAMPAGGKITSSCMRSQVFQGIGWKKIEKEQVAALKGYAETRDAKEWSSLRNKISPSGSVYYQQNDKEAKDTPIAAFIEARLAILSAKNPLLVHEKSEGMKNKNGYPITVLKLNGLENRRFTVVSIIDSPCGKEEHVLSAPHEEMLQKDFKPYFDAVMSTNIEP
jgi:hypothetical protein